jgi:hypothetical protein
MAANINGRQQEYANIFRGRASKKVTKIERYNWADTSKPGALEWIEKDLLLVDSTYQRAENEAKVHAIARGWSWPAVGALIVAVREGKYYVIDGGHRLQAAMRRADVARLPCVVFESSGMKEEAQAFLDSNTLRKPVTAVEKFKAMKWAGNEAAIAIAEMCDEHDVTVTSSSHANSGKSSVKCIYALLLLYRTSEATFRRIWPLAVELCDGQLMHHRVVMSLFHIERKLDWISASLLKKPWVDRVRALGSEGIMQATAKAATYHGKSNESVWVEGVLKALNHGARNRLSLMEVTNK